MVCNSICEIKKLYIELTSYCNFNCSMCFRNSWFDEKNGYMSDELIDKLLYDIGYIDSIDTITLAGMGEPLLHQKVVDIIRFLNKMGKNTQIITNASLLNEEISRELISSGLTQLWVSADDLHIKTTKNRFNDVMQNILNFNKIRMNKCALGLTFVLESINENELKRINETADFFGADEINISQIIPSKPIDKYSYRDNISIGKMKRIEIIQKSCQNYCPFIESGSCFVKWNGNVVPCMQLLHNSYTYLYQEKRKVWSHSFGNILYENVNEIWSSKDYTEFRERVHNFDFPNCTLCDGCDDRKENKTDCLFNNAPTCGACLWAQNIAICP